MKLWMLACSILIAFSSNAQRQINDSTYMSRDSLLFTIGQKITIGTGTLPDGSFKYIYLNPAKWYVATNITGPDNTPMSSNAAGYQATIVRIKKSGSQKTGFKYFLTLSFITKNDAYIVDIEPALHSGEVLKESSHK